MTRRAITATMPHMITLQDIQDAALRLQGQVLTRRGIPNAPQIVRAQVFLPENLQFTARSLSAGLQQAHAAHGRGAIVRRGRHERATTRKGHYRATSALRAVIVMPRFTPA